MKKLVYLLLMLCALTGCVKNKCYVVLGADNQELCSKCFHTTDERSVWMQANTSKTPEEQCK